MSRGRSSSTPSSSGWRSASSAAGRTRRARRGTGRRGGRGSPRRVSAAARRRPAPRTSSCDAARETAARRRRPPSRSSPATLSMTVTSSASSSLSGGRRPGMARASSVLPAPGGPTSSRLWPPASATSSAQRACCWPRTSARSTGSIGDAKAAAVRMARRDSGRGPDSSTASRRLARAAVRPRGPATSRAASSRPSTPTASTPRHEPRLSFVRGGHDDAPVALPGERGDHRQHARDRLDRARQRQLAEQRPAAAAAPDLSARRRGCRPRWRGRTRRRACAGRRARG